MMSRRKRSFARPREQRWALEQALGIGESASQLWDQVKLLLQERREFSIAFHTAFLLPLNGSTATIATPVKFFCGVIDQRADWLRSAIEQITGKTIETVETKYFEPPADIA